MKRIQFEEDSLQTTIEELVEVALDDNEPTKVVLVGAQLNEEDRKKLLSFLRKNKDVFAWTHEDMPGIDPRETSHKLNVDPDHPPVKQKQRRFSPEMN